MDISTIGCPTFGVSESSRLELFFELHWYRQGIGKKDRKEGSVLKERHRTKEEEKNGELIEEWAHVIIEDFLGKACFSNDAKQPII